LERGTNGIVSGIRVAIEMRGAYPHRAHRWFAVETRMSATGPELVLAYYDSMCESGFDNNSSLIADEACLCVAEATQKA
jgi:hypothetical protein